MQSVEIAHSAARPAPREGAKAGLRGRRFAGGGAQSPACTAT